MSKESGLTYEQEKEINHKRNLELQFKAKEILMALGYGDFSYMERLVRRQEYDRDQDTYSYWLGAESKKDERSGIMISWTEKWSYRYEEKFEISGHYPIYPRDCGAIHYDAKDLKIGVSIGKTIDQIVKDIQKRFLPEYLEIYKKCKEYKDAKDSRNDLKWAKAKAIGELVGDLDVAPCAWKSGAIDDRANITLKDPLRGHISTFDGKTFDIEIRELSQDNLLKVLKALGIGRK